jgi:hypothetical protein
MQWRLTELPFLGVCLPRQSVYVSVSVGGCLCYRHTCWWWCCGLSAAQRKRERGYLPLFADDDREHSLDVETDLTLSLACSYRCFLNPLTQTLSAARCRFESATADDTSAYAHSTAGDSISGISALKADLTRSPEILSVGFDALTGMQLSWVHQSC